MASRSREVRNPFAEAMTLSAHPSLGRLRHLSLVVIAAAAAVAAVAALLHSDGSVAESPAESGLRLQIAVPGVGRGAPMNLAELRSAVPSGESARAAAIYQHDVSTAVTARRYATHLVADLVTAPGAVAAPLTSPEEVQALLAIASTPQLIRAAVPVDEGAVTGDAVLLARLGLPPGSPLPAYFTYPVVRGDTVDNLARRFGLQPESILFNNWEIIDPGDLEPGSTLTVPTRDGVVYTVLLGDTFDEIIANYAADAEATLAFVGNNLAGADQLVEGETILLVNGSATVLPSFGGGPVFAIPDFQWPMGGVLTDFFGAPRGNRYGYHTGIDLSAPTGTFVGAAAPGVVVQAGWAGSFGNSVIVDHGGGVVTRYAHMDYIDVFLGEFVNPGDLIGFVGSTGEASGPHLHFEIIMGGVPVDPLIWLNS